MTTKPEISIGELLGKVVATCSTYYIGNGSMQPHRCREAAEALVDAVCFIENLQDRVKALEAICQKK